MKLNEVIAKYGNQEVDELKIKELELKLEKETRDLNRLKM